MLNQQKTLSVSFCFALFTIPVAGCGSDTDDTPDAGNDPIELRGSCDQGDHLGSFQVAVTDDFSSVDGQIYDGVFPVSIRTEVMNIGGCKLMRRVNPFCDPGCSGQQVCDHDGVCKATPVAQDIGSVVVTGLKESISMDPRAPGNNYFATPAANPIYDTDAEVRLRNADGSIALGGFGSTPLSLTDEDWMLAAGQPLELTWTAPTEASPTTHVFFDLTIDQHGTSPVALECEFPDTGSAMVSAELVDALRAEGVSGFPNGAAKRRTADRVSVNGGCVDFFVSSEDENSVVVDGHTPCERDEDCTAPQTCDIPNQTCV